jgi:hypothetical protein
MAMSKITRLGDVGLLDPAALTQDDREIIERLTDAEIEALIQIALRIYPEGHEIVKLGDLAQGTARIYVPL